MRRMVDTHARHGQGRGARGVASAAGRLLLLALTTLALLLLMASFTATAFAQGGHIQGTVTDAGSTPLQGITVTAYAYDFSFGSWSYAADTLTDAAGAYDLGGLASTYFIVRFDDPSAIYFGEYYDDQQAWDNASWLWLDPDATLPGIDAALARPCSIGGVVTSARTGDPLANAQVSVYSPNAWGYWDYVTTVLTDYTGAYAVTGLRPGEYRLSFATTDGLHVTEYYDDAVALEVATTLFPGDGEALTGYDAALDEYSSISGSVTDVYGMGVSTVLIQLYRSDGAGNWSYYSYAYSDSNGDYTLPGLPAGVYRVDFIDYSGGFLEEFFDDARTFDAATDIVVAGSENLTDIDARLSTYGHIAGTVTDTDGAGLADIWVDVYRYVPEWGGYQSVASVQTNADGTYDAGTLTAGAYRVGFHDWSHGIYVDEYYDNAAQLTLGTDVWVVLDLTTGGIDAVLSKPGSISGTVRDPAGDPVRGVYLDVYDADYGDWDRWVGWAQTNADGTYTVGGLQTGQYHVVFYPRRPYMTEYWNDQQTMAAADVVDVTFGAETGGIDARLGTGASISGRVSGPEGLDLERSWVTAYRADGSGGWDYAGDASTDATGLYTIRRLLGGTYRVEFDGGGSFFTEWWNDKMSRAEADDIVVPRDGAVGGIDAQLTEGSSIQGTVTGTTGEALAGISVSAYRQNGHGGWDYARDTSTDAAGHYSLRRLLGGTYRVGFHDWDQNEFLGEYWDDETEWAAADPLTIAFGESRTGIDAQLTRASRIGGTVTDEAGAPLSGISVVAYAVTGDGEWTYVSDASTDATGTYLIKGLREGAYRISFRDWNRFYAPEWFDDQPTIAAADDVAVGIDETVPGVDAVLGESGKIRGMVSTSDATPLANVHVIAYADDGLGGWEYVTDVTTDVAGYYEIRGLASGDYRVGFKDVWWWWDRDAGTYLDEFWNDKATLAEADAVGVTAPNATEGIDAVLTPGGHIGGTVTGADGATLGDVVVSAYKSDGSGGWDYIGDTSTDASGVYDVATLQTGTYRIRFSPPWSSEYVGEYYDDKASLADADDIGVTAGASTVGIDAVLARGSRIAGTVTLPSGAAAAGVRVTAYREAVDEGWLGWADATTDATGTYTIRGLPSGDYKVGFSPPTAEYAYEYWNDQATLAGGDLVTVPVDGIVEHIDAQLGLGGSITGAVTAGDVPRADVHVSAYAAKPGGGWEYIRDVSTDSAGDGTYALDGLPPGTYRVKFDAHDPDLAPEFFNDKATLTAADDVAVAAGGVTPGIDADLGAAGRITGTVTSDGGEPLGDIRVTAYRGDGSGGYEYVADLTTDFTGAYTIRGLAADTYWVHFDPWLVSTSGWSSEWYHDAATQAEATGVHVVAAETTVVDESLTHVATIVSLTSSTHPDEVAWYEGGDAALEWIAYNPAVISGYSFVLDHAPSTVPDRLSEGRTASTTYAGLADGIWYFHVRGVVPTVEYPWWTYYAWGPAEHFALHIDGTAPTTQATGAEGWHAGPVQVTLSPDDAVSGMSGGFAKTEYKVDEAADWTEGTDVLVPARPTGEDDGTHAITFRSTDAAGNVEADKTVDVLIDTAAPSVSDDAGDGWHANGWTLHLEAADGLSGIAGVEYAIDDGAWISGTEHVFTLPRKRSNTGRVYEVVYRATDAAGNTTEGACAVRIDNLAPLTADDADDLAHAVDTTVHLTATDEHSGVAETWYSLDGQPWELGAEVLVAAPTDHTGDGLHTIVYYSVDVIGNVEAVRMCTVLIDTAAGG